MDWKITKQSFVCRTTLFFFSISICLFSLYALFSTINNNTNKTVCLDIRNPTGTNSDSYFQELDEKIEEKIKDQEVEEDQILSSSTIRRSLFHYSLMSRFSISRRYLSVVPGSSPPRCTSKCGKCTPCKPVHVPVPPGTPVTTEYYPEAWRCKCGNKLYMP